MRGFVEMRQRGAMGTKPRECYTASMLGEGSLCRGVLAQRRKRLGRGYTAGQPQSRTQTWAPDASLGEVAGQGSSGLRNGGYVS